MNNKFYVSLEAARLLKEKGYKEFYNAYYWDNKLRIGGFRGPEWYNVKEFFPAPTKAEAIDWLESKGIYVATSFTYSGEWLCTIYSLNRDEMVSTLDFQTRLEAEDAAIIKALELL